MTALAISFTLPGATRLWIERIATALLLTLAAVFVLLIAGRAVGVKSLIERTSSMQPAIAPGDLLLSRSVPALDLHRGDVVSFPDSVHPDIPTTHRIVALERVGGKLAVTTRGDANPAAEQWTTPVNSHVSRVALTVPQAGTVVSAISGRWARLALLVSASLGLALFALRRIWRA